MGSVELPADRRTYYLSNLTCATSVRFQIRAENQIGMSPLTDPISAKTEGSGQFGLNFGLKGFFSLITAEFPSLGQLAEVGACVRADMLSCVHSHDRRDNGDR